MKSKRMLMGAVFIGCVSAGLISAASAQDTGAKGRFNARASGQLNGAHNGHAAGVNGQLDARAAGGERRSTGGRMNVSERRDEGRFGHEGRNFAEERTMRGERGAYARLSEGRGWRGERGLYAYAGAEGGYGRSWRGNRRAYRTNAPGYDVGYSVGSYYDYAPTYSYDVGVTAAPYYAPGLDVAYGGPYYGPGVGVGIGIGPIGIGIGPAWGW